MLICKFIIILSHHTTIFTDIMWYMTKYLTMYLKKRSVATLYKFIGLDSPYRILQFLIAIIFWNFKMFVIIS